MQNSGHKQQNPRQKHTQNLRQALTQDFRHQLNYLWQMHMQDLPLTLHVRHKLKNLRQMHMQDLRRVITLNLRHKQMNLRQMRTQDLRRTQGGTSHYRSVSFALHTSSWTTPCSSRSSRLGFVRPTLPVSSTRLGRTCMHGACGFGVTGGRYPRRDASCRPLI